MSDTILNRYRTSVQPTREPVSLGDLKDHLRVTGTTDDLQIGIYARAARERAEKFQRRAFCTQTRVLTLDAWPCGRELELIGAPLQSITSVTYIPDGESPVTLSSSAYIVDTESEPGRLVLKTDEEWPSDELQPVNGVQVTYVCGYGVNTATVTITIAAPGVVTWAGHGLFNGDTVVFSTTGALPTGLAAGTTYYVVSRTVDTFQLAATYGGAAITTTGTQSGVHTGTADGRPASMPWQTHAAIKLMVGHLFERREGTADQSSGNVTEIPLGVRDLLEPNRLAVFA